MRMRPAGQRPHRLELQANEPVKGPTGFQDHWVPKGGLWAAIQSASAGPSERPIANTTDASITHLVETDFRTDVRISDRLRRENGTFLYVVGQPENVELRDHVLVIPCEERAA